LLLLFSFHLAAFLVLLTKIDASLLSNDRYVALCGSGKNDNHHAGRCMVLRLSCFAHQNIMCLHRFISTGGATVTRMVNCEQLQLLLLGCVVDGVTRCVVVAQHYGEISVLQHTHHWELTLHCVCGLEIWITERMIVVVTQEHITNRNDRTFHLCTILWRGGI